MCGRWLKDAGFSGLFTTVAAMMAPCSVKAYGEKRGSRCLPGTGRKLRPVDRLRLVAGEMEEKILGKCAMPASARRSMRTRTWPISFGISFSASRAGVTFSFAAFLTLTMPSARGPISQTSRPDRSDKNGPATGRKSRRKAVFAFMDL